MLKDNNLTITMVTLLVGAHYGWRRLQDNEAFVPKGQEKEYPWVEAARHIKAAQVANSEVINNEDGK